MSDAAWVGDRIKTPLYPHQKQGLYWMLFREYEGDVPAAYRVTASASDTSNIATLWEKRRDEQGRVVHVNVVTEQTTHETPPPCRGGILGDDVGRVAASIPRLTRVPRLSFSRWVLVKR